MKQTKQPIPAPAYRSKDTKRAARRQREAQARRVREWRE